MNLYIFLVEGPPGFTVGIQPSRKFFLCCLVYGTGAHMQQLRVLSARMVLGIVQHLLNCYIMCVAQLASPPELQGDSCWYARQQYVDCKCYRSGNVKLYSVLDIRNPVGFSA